MIRVLYGATSEGGPESRGAIFRIRPDGAEKVIASFTALGLNSPQSGLLFDGRGQLIGSAGFYNNEVLGGVFELGRNGDLNAIRALKTNDDACGVLPNGLIKDTRHNLFGTTVAGGGLCLFYGGGCGIAYEITSNGAEIILHKFGHASRDGYFPRGTLITDHHGRRDNVPGRRIRRGGPFSKSRSSSTDLQVYNKPSSAHNASGKPLPRLRLRASGGPASATARAHRRRRIWARALRSSLSYTAFCRMAWLKGVSLVKAQG